MPGGRRRRRGRRPPLRIAADWAEAVLIVDDNATNRRILVAQTARWGMVPRETGSPHEALRWLAAGERFDIALFDLLMPELDGIEFAARRSREPPTERAPTCRSSSSPRSAFATARSRVAAWLAKPVKPSALHDTIANVLLGRRRPAVAARREPPSARDRWAASSAAHPARRGQRGEPEARPAAAGPAELQGRGGRGRARRPSAPSSTTATTWC